MSSKLVLVFLVSALILICSTTVRSLGGLQGSSATDDEKVIVIADGGDEGIDGGVVGEGIGSRIVGDDGIGEGIVGDRIGDENGGTVIVNDGIGEGIGSRVIGDRIGEGEGIDGEGEGIDGDVEGGYRWESGVREGDGIIGREIP